MLGRKLENTSAKVPKLVICPDFRDVRPLFGLNPKTLFFVTLPAIFKHKVSALGISSVSITYPKTFLPSSARSTAYRERTNLLDVLYGFSYSKVLKTLHIYCRPAIPRDEGSEMACDGKPHAQVYNCASSGVPLLTTAWIYFLALSLTAVDGRCFGMTTGGVGERQTGVKLIVRAAPSTPATLLYDTHGIVLIVLVQYSQ
ncbi:hypothetical protein CYMTET_31337 [Cymbomonas tetramitiformis]|uniref:Uncharacterized protein n=1 Tax=Cymbomonas tetramitiformis TaxID=36881 RepID=A0AAE0FHG4_9CHLO|nr:hypothetical protein CYMTET_31337 [Cymbomonas tetramitiformis]